MNRFTEQNQIRTGIFLSLHRIKVEQAIKDLRQRQQVNILVILLILNQQLKQIVDLVHVLRLGKGRLVVHFLFLFDGFGVEKL